MDVKYCASEEEDEGDLSLYWFKELEQSVLKGQLSSSKDGPYSAEGSWVLQDVTFWWILGLQPIFGAWRWSVEKNLYDTIGYIYVH